jgi:hypothetical protein
MTTTAAYNKPQHRRLSPIATMAVGGGMYNKTHDKQWPLNGPRHNSASSRPAQGGRKTAIIVYNKTLTTRKATPAAPRLRITKPLKGGRPTKDPKGTLVAVRLSGRQVHALERRSRREVTGLSEALRRCLDEWAAAQDAAPMQSKQEVIKKQPVAAGTRPTRRRTRRKTK